MSWAACLFAIVAPLLAVAVPVVAYALGWRHAYEYLRARGGKS